VHATPAAAAHTQGGDTTAKNAIKAALQYANKAPQGSGSGSGSGDSGGSDGSGGSGGGRSGGGRSDPKPVRCGRGAWGVRMGDAARTHTHGAAAA
jgi:hypothetical protein